MSKLTDSLGQMYRLGNPDNLSHSLFIVSQEFFPETAQTLQDVTYGRSQKTASDILADYEISLGKPSFEKDEDAWTAYVRKNAHETAADMTIVFLRDDNALDAALKTFRDVALGNNAKNSANFYERASDGRVYEKTDAFIKHILAKHRAQVCSIHTFKNDQLHSYKGKPAAQIFNPDGSSMQYHFREGKPCNSDALSLSRAFVTAGGNIVSGEEMKNDGTLQPVSTEEINQRRAAPRRLYPKF
jgi:hypothetical protein